MTFTVEWFALFEKQNVLIRESQEREAQLPTISCFTVHISMSEVLEIMVSEGHFKGNEAKQCLVFLKVYILMSIVTEDEVPFILSKILISFVGNM